MEIGEDNIVDTLLGFIGYALVTSITPGPNNAMLLASGLNFGFRRSAPHMFGITAGFGLMFAAIGLGASAVFRAYPGVHELLRVLGTLYLLYLAWSIAQSAPVTETDRQQGRPMSFLAAAAFQWINPKAWMMATGAVSTYLPAGASESWMALLVAVFCAVNAPCIAVWTAFGVLLRRWLTNPVHALRFNVGMALALCATALPNVIDLAHAISRL